jgi:hypothetical protein
VNQVSIRYPWTDVNGDRVVQRNELDTTSFITKSSTFDPANPTSFASPGAVDPNIKNDRTREFILGYQREVARNIGLELNYIWRKYDRFQFDDRVNWDSSNFQAVSFTPTNCSAEAICGPITFYKPTSRQPSAFITTNQPDRYRNYNGVELAVTKRYSDRWMGNFSFAFNDATDYWGSPRAFEDPTNIDKLNGHEFAPESGGSGLDSVFTNAKWLMKASGMYSLPWAGVNVAANTNYHQGYPFPTAINVTTRGGGLGTATVLLEPLGDIRLPNTFTLDLRVDKVFQFGAMRMIPSVDVFNVTNANTVQSRRRVIYTLNGTTLTGSSPTNANQISSIIAPRVVRFGVRVNW